MQKPIGAGLAAVMAACFLLAACGGNTATEEEGQSMPVPGSVAEGDGQSSTAIIGGADGPTAVFVTGGGPLDSLGRYCPDGPLYYEGFYDAAYQNALKDGVQNIEEEHLAMLAQLQDSYRQRTVAQQLELLRQLIEESDSEFNSGFLEAVSVVTYAGMYDNYQPMDDFYTSLYFTLQQYYYTYGPENIQDLTHSFSYHRLLEQPEEGKEVDWQALVFFSYDTDIDYFTPETTTIAQRDDALAAMVQSANQTLDGYTEADWQSEDCAAQIKRDLRAVFEGQANEHLAITMLAVNYDQL